MSAGLSIEQLLLALQRKGIPLPFEMGTFLVLEATEQVLTLEATGQTSGFCVVGRNPVWLSDQGEVAVDSAAHAPEPEACRALVVLLSDLLVRSAPGVPAMLLDLVEQGPSDGQWTLMRLRDDLEASLVPLNRSAMRRVLARLLREVRREADRGQSATAPDAGALDLEFDAVLGSESTSDKRAKPATSARTGRAPRTRADEDATAEVDLDELVPHQPAVEFAAAQASATARRKSRVAAPAREPSPRESNARAAGAGAGGEGLDEFEHAASAGSSSGVRIGIGLALLGAALGAGYLLLGQQASRGALGLSPRPEVGSPRAPARTQAERRARVGELRVSSTPARAQVFLRVGTGPAVVPRLPVGVAHEFVALAETSAPARAVVPTDAHWEQEAGELRYELALQLGDASGHRVQDDLGPTRLPQQLGSPKGPLGSVRIITSPPGAKVYQLIGFTPDVRVENLEITPQVELLVYLSGYGLQRVIVGEADWKQEPAGLTAELDLKLTPRGK